MASDQGDEALVEAVASAINEAGWEFLEQHPHGGYADWFNARCKAAIRVVREAVAADLSAAEAAAARGAVERCVGVLGGYAEFDQQLCCDGRECGCQGATVFQEMEHYLRKNAIPPPGALDRVRQAARAEGMEAAASLIMPTNDKSDWTEYAHIRAEAAAAIRAAKDQPA